MKRALALILAIFLAFPSFAFSDEVIINPDDGLVIEDMPEGGLDLFSGDIEPPALELTDITLEDLDDPQSEDNNVPKPVTPAPFNQTVTVDDIIISLSAEAGSLPADSVLRVSKLKDKATRQAVRKAAKAAVEGELTHYIFSIEVLDAAGNAVVPNGETELPVVCVKGLDAPGDYHVIVYDEIIGGYYETEAEMVGEGLKFSFAESAIYDIVVPGEES